MKNKEDVLKHILAPRHVLLNDKEKQSLFEKYSITGKELPKILKNDPGIKQLNSKIGDVIKIVRKSRTAGEALFYREVINA